MFGITFNDILTLYPAAGLCAGDVAVLPLLAGYIVLLERKVMADMQVRLGPMRVGPHGLAAADRRCGEAAAEGRHHRRRERTAWLFWGRR